MDAAAVEWLLASDEPAVRYLARRDLLDEPAEDDRAQILDGPKVRALLEGQRDDGGFGVGPYAKWGGAHWRLVSLVELAAPADEPRLRAAAETVLAWLTGPSHRRNVPTIEGRARRCASQEGNALAVCSRLGLAQDERVELLATSLVEWQWPDGGWNCDRRPEAWRSSFHESLAPAWGLHEYAVATGAGWARTAADRTAELFLEHRVFRTRLTGEPIHPSFVTLHYPPYWHFDVLQCLVVLARLGKARDPRAADALDLLDERRRPDGLWAPGGYWWRPPGSRGSNVEVVDWGRRRPSEMITLNALRIRHAAGLMAAAARLPRTRRAA
jgi:hypothetical protein